MYLIVVSDMIKEFSLQELNSLLKEDLTCQTEEHQEEQLTLCFLYILVLAAVSQDRMCRNTALAL